MRKFLVFFLLSFLLISCSKEKQNLETNSSGNIQTENTEITEEEYNAFINSLKENSIQKDFKELSSSELKTAIYTTNATKNMKQKIEELKNDENVENKFKATYLESFTGDYKNSLAEREKLCKENPENTQYCKKITVNLNSPIIKDNNGTILKDIKTYFDGRELKKDGTNIELEPNFEHRIKYVKEGYLPHFEKISTSNQNEKLGIKPILHKAKAEELTVASNEELKIKTQKFETYIDKNAYKTADGKTYNGEVNVYFFELGKDENDSSVFQLDVFDQNKTLLGTSMITFGMPYITAYDTEGNELEVEKFKGKGIIQNPEDMPGIDLKNVPKNVYLNYNQLLEYNIPPFWYLTKDGVWISGEMKILDEKGNYEFIYNN